MGLGQCVGHTLLDEGDAEMFPREGGEEAREQVHRGLDEYTQSARPGDLFICIFL